MHVADTLSADELQALADRETNRRRFVRLRAVILALQGWKTLEIVEALGASRRAIQEWIARYNAHGIDGLTARPKTGRPSFLTATQLEQFRERIGAGPLPVDGTCTLRGPEVRALLEREFGVIYSLPAVYVLLHRLGYECLDPRPRHQKADPVAQEEFKKKSAIKSMKSPRLIKENASKSGSRTKRDSANKER